MKFFLDSANLDEIIECDKLGLLDGVTTNPTLISKVVSSKNEMFKTYEKICEICGDRPVSCEVFSTDYEGMKNEAKELLKIAKNVCIKLPITEDGLRLCKEFSDDGIKTNMTLCFSPMQALLVAKAGATYVSPFVGRLDDTCGDGLALVEDIRNIYDNYGFQTQILAASIRTVKQVEEVAKIGSDVATMPFKIIKQLFKHPLTDNGLAAFVNDVKKIG